MCDVCRRNFLKTASGAAVGGLLFPGAGADAASLQQKVSIPEFEPPSFDLGSSIRHVSWVRQATGETLSLEYMRYGHWVDGAYDKMCEMLRDVQADKAVRIDPLLLGMLDWTQSFLRKYGYTEPLHILSGFRTEQTNSRLANAARNSQHLYGKAVDFYAPGVPAHYLGSLFKWLAAGGIGVYPQSRYVHIDTGRPRTWTG